MVASPETLDRFSRRHLLQIGGLGLLGVTLPRLLETQARAASSGIVPKADAGILLFLNGGPSHLDMWDMKPAAPDGDPRGIQPIATSLPEYQVSEHMPRLARHMHRATIVRSMHHGVNNSHAAAVYASLTGHDRGEIGGGTQADRLSVHQDRSSGLLRPPAAPCSSACHDAVHDEGRCRRAAAARILRRILGTRPRSAVRAPRSERQGFCGPGADVAGRH